MFKRIPTSKASNKEFALAFLPGAVGLEFFWLWVNQPTPAVTWRLILAWVGCIISMVWLASLIWRDKVWLRLSRRTCLTPVNRLSTR
jgi:hypothetical protein